MNKPEYILIHCTDCSYKTIADQFLACDIWHRDRGFPLSSLGYHIGYQRLITGGQNYQARLDTDVGAHCNQGIDAAGNIIASPKPGTSMNFRSVAACVGFDGDIEPMPAAEYALLRAQVWEWQDKYGIPNEKVRFHRDFAPTKSCPGSLITRDWLKTLLTRPEPPKVVPEEPQKPNEGTCADVGPHTASEKQPRGLLYRFLAWVFGIS